jgi:hypothetical protein
MWTAMKKIFVDKNNQEAVVVSSDLDCIVHPGGLTVRNVGSIVLRSNIVPVSTGTMQLSSTELSVFGSDIYAQCTHHYSFPFFYNGLNHQQVSSM